MAIFTKTTKNLIAKIDDFFDNIDLGLLVFGEGVSSYLRKDMEGFKRHLDKVDLLESNADKLQSDIENEMIMHSILPQHRAEVCTLLDEMDEIIDAIKSTLHEFYIELPEIPSILNDQVINLTEASISAGEELIPAARAFFKAPYTVREKLIKVYYFEGETDKIGLAIRKQLFQEMPEIDLAHKAHIRYILKHIENISDMAQKAADLLSGMAMRIVM
jgi:predicted phosphate transport protein (TIGR00153 family)